MSSSRSASFDDVNVVNFDHHVKPVMIGRDAIVSVGEEILDLFVVSRGGAVALEVNVTRSVPRILRELGKGDVFGAERSCMRTRAISATRTCGQSAGT